MPIVPPDAVATGEGNVFGAPAPGGVVAGLAGTNDPARLVERQSFQVATIFMLDVPTQRWLVYVPDAPALVSSLRTGLLREDSVVTVRRALAPSAPAPLPSPTVTPEPTPASGVTADEAAMVALVNEARAANGLAPLVIDEELVAVARAHSVDMRDRDFFAHTNPDGADPFDRMQAAGIDYRFAGENLALAGTVPRAHELLMESEGHRRNILSDNFGHIGIGIVESSQGLLITQVFTD